MTGVLKICALLFLLMSDVHGDVDKVSPQLNSSAAVVQSGEAVLGPPNATVQNTSVVAQPGGADLALQNATVQKPLVTQPGGAEVAPQNATLQTPNVAAQTGGTDVAFKTATPQNATDVAQAKGATLQNATLSDRPQLAQTEPADANANQSAITPQNATDASALVQSPNATGAGAALENQTEVTKNTTQFSQDAPPAVTQVGNLSGPLVNTNYSNQTAPSAAETSLPVQNASNLVSNLSKDLGTGSPDGVSSSLKSELGNALRARSAGMGYPDTRYASDLHFHTPRRRPKLYERYREWDGPHGYDRVRPSPMAAKMMHAFGKEAPDDSSESPLRSGRSSSTDAHAPDAPQGRPLDQMSMHARSRHSPESGETMSGHPYDSIARMPLLARSSHGATRQFQEAMADRLRRQGLPEWMTRKFAETRSPDGYAARSSTAAREWRSEGGQIHQEQDHSTEGLKKFLSRRETGHFGASAQKTILTEHNLDRLARMRETAVQKMHEYSHDHLDNEQDWLTSYRRLALTVFILCNAVVVYFCLFRKESKAPVEPYRLPNLQRYENNGYGWTAIGRSQDEIA